MVVRNKMYRVFDKYRKYLDLKADLLKGVQRSGYGATTKGNRSKNKVLDFYLKNNRWPSRLSKSKTERLLATRFENYISKEARSYDPHFRRLAMATGRTTNNKRKHDIEGFKKEILEFVKTHGRVPSTSYKYQTVEGEARLRHKLDYYTNEKNDMILLGKVYAVDKCHLSGIPAKYRKIINESLKTEKPLIRLV